MTRLTALELAGFKSFADRTRFEFPPGITAVVGPNGSGKSNVVDALKWVLGEQSVRSLRGRDMTDVIFAGSAGRKPLNAAEVTLSFDNAARALAVDAAEVRITRRVYRSGEGEYLINGEAARLRDIRELFSGTGAATEAYSVIEQGRVDALLVASGRDRRAVFEEAAGITRFRARRTEALRRLERTEQNRQRLADIVGELTARLQTVRTQAARARTYRDSSARLRALRLSAARRDLAAVATDAETVAARIAAVTAAAAAAQAAADAATTAAAALEDDLLRSGPLLDELRAEARGHDLAAATVAATLDALRRQRVAADHESHALAGDLAAAGRRSAGARTVADQAAAAVDDALRDEARLAAALADMERSAAGGQQQATDLRASLGALAARAESLARERLRIVADGRRAADRADAARSVLEATRTRAEALRGRRADTERALATLDGAVTALGDRVAAATAALATAERDGLARSEAAAAADRDLAAWETTLGACRERVAVLGELTARHEGVADAVRDVLALPGGGALPAATGLLADTLDVPLEWAALVDVALGPLRHGIAVAPGVEASAALAAWQETPAGRAALAAGGRVTIVAPDLLPAPEAWAPDDTAGVVGRLDRLVAADGRDDDRAARILGHVWVVDDLIAARRCLTGAPAGTIALTRRGEALTGRVVAEVGDQAAAVGLVARRAELRAARLRADELVEAVGRAREARDEAAAAARAAEQSARLARTRRDQAAAELADCRLERDRRAHDAARADDECTAAAAAVAAAERDLVVCAEAERLAAADLEAHGRLEAEAAHEAERTAAELAALDRTRGSVAEALAGLRASRDAATARVAAARTAAAGAQAEAVRLADERSALATRWSAAATRHAELEGEELSTGQALAAAARSAEDAARAVRTAADRRDADLDARGRLAATATAERERLATLQAALHGHELEAGELRHRRERILERVREDYGIDPLDGEPDADTDAVADRAALDAEIEQLRRRLAAMGSVNMEALAEADALAERLATLDGQLADLTQARQAIEQLIGRIDEESRRLLGETIETVRGHFRDLFTRLFGGGQADIVLDPALDLLETSVEIVARPPGKEPRGIGLLSGGEKTMTCVALLLAIFRSRPSPFCVLDEVDAALDEANVDRFTAALGGFRDTQFIVVTHSKKTMAAAGTLYGVTMEESGVSKRVAVHLERRAAESRPRAAA